MLSHGQLMGSRTIQLQVTFIDSSFQDVMDWAEGGKGGGKVLAQCMDRRMPND